MVKQTNVGLIGYSEGNGHPYSFSAIINGYDQEEMNSSPYPGIANYLSVRSPDEFGIGNLKVTHVWAPDHSIAKNIAECTYIPHISDHYTDMIEEVDVVLILRDDASSHREIATPFLESGKYVFIDKPLCTNREDMEYFKPWLDKGKLMSCSGFRYYPSIVNRVSGDLKRDEVVFSHSISIIDWFRYGIHVLEGITPIMGTDVKWVQDVGEPNNHIVRIQYEDGKYALIQVNTDLGFILRSSFYTRSNTHFTINYDDNFSCFRGILEAFHQQINSGKPAIDPNETEAIINILIAANRSLNEGGIRIDSDLPTTPSAVRSRKKQSKI